MDAKERFRLKLFEIASKLTIEKLESLKYLCADFIPLGDAEKIKTVKKLFQELEHRQKIGPHRLDFLQECLRRVGREDLATELTVFDRECASEAGKG